MDLATILVVALDLEQTLMRYVVRRSLGPMAFTAHSTNTQLPQSALRSRTPMQAMKDWHKSHPHLFVKSTRNRPGCDIYHLSCIDGTCER